jgi:hypothetical protein
LQHLCVPLWSAASAAAQSRKSPESGVYMRPGHVRRVPRTRPDGIGLVVLVAALVLIIVARPKGSIAAGISAITVGLGVTAKGVGAPLGNPVAKSRAADLASSPRRNPARGRRRRFSAPAPARVTLGRARQITALLAAARALDESARTRSGQRRALLAVLVFAGLRIGEALRASLVRAKP